MEPLSRDDVSDWVRASFCLARLVDPGREAATRAGPWVQSALAERLDLPPLGVVADVGALLFGAPLEPLRRPSLAAQEDDALARALRRYEDTVLGRLAADSRVTSAGFAVARLPKAMHAQAAGLLVASMLARIGFQGGIEVAPGIVRTVTGRAVDEGMQRGYAAIRENAQVRAALARGYEALVHAAQRARDLVGDADVFALENLTVLGSLTQRLAIAEILHAEEALSSRIPKRITSRRKRDGAVATQLEDESAYPVGGFSSISTSGTLENLVTSELIYMDPNDPPISTRPGGKKSSADVDLFDMRYVEGELLYYTRDEAIFVRQRRVVVFAMSADLARARVKDPELRWQRIVLAMAAVMTLTKKLSVLLGTEALSFRVVFLEGDGRGRTSLADERELALLLLREWCDKGIAEVTDGSWELLAEQTRESARRAAVEIVRFTTTPGEAPFHELDPRVVLVDYPVVGTSLDGWVETTTDVLAALL